MGSWIGINKEQDRAYGYLNIEPGLTLGLEEVLNAVELVAAQLIEKGKPKTDQTKGYVLMPSICRQAWKHRCYFRPRQSTSTLSRSSY